MLRVIVYLILAAVEVDDTTVEDAVTLTVKELLATPDKFIPLPNVSPEISECLYWVPDAISAMGDGVKLLGPGPIILKTYEPVQDPFAEVKHVFAVD